MEKRHFILGHEKSIFMDGKSVTRDGFFDYTDGKLDKRIESIKEYQSIISAELDSWNDKLKELIKNNTFCKDYYDYHQSNMTCADFFVLKGYVFQNATQLRSQHKQEINALEAIEREIKDCKSFIWSEEEINELIRKSEKAMEEKRLAEEKKLAEEQKENEAYLKQVKEGKQICISLLDEKTHHLINKSDEINLYLAFGYELLSNLTKGAVVFLKPSADYSYSKEFEDSLLAFKKMKNINRTVIAGGWRDAY